MSSRYRTLGTSGDEKAFALSVQPNSAANLVTIKFIGTSGQDFTVFWDIADASVSDTYTHTGSVITATHTYADTDIKVVTVQGAMGKLEDPGGTTAAPDYSDILAWGNVTLIADQSDFGLYANSIIAGTPGNVSQPNQYSNYRDWPLFVSNTNCTDMFKDSTEGYLMINRLADSTYPSAGFGWPPSVTSNITNMSGMFSGAFKRRLSAPGDTVTASVNGWDVSNVTDMSNCFKNTGYLNLLSDWNTINVTNMSSMFDGVAPGIVPSDCLFTNFAPGIDQWNVSNVTNMSSMFQGVQGAQGNLSLWNTQSVTNLSNTFSRSASATPVEWNTGNVTTLSGTFYATEGNIDCSGWNTQNTTNMSHTFSAESGLTLTESPTVTRCATKPDLSSWNVSSVTNMANIMNGYEGSPQIDSWNVSSVTDMSYGFGANYLRATDGGGNPINADYNASITMDPSGWVTSSLANAQNTFSGSTLNTNLGAWNISSITTMKNMLDDSSMSTENYSKTLIGWANFVSNAGGTPASITMGAANVTYNNATHGSGTYTDAVSARAYLTGTAGWTITDGGVV